MKLKIFSYITVLLVALTFAACKDDLIYNPSDIPDGEGDLNAELTITMPQEVAIGSRTPGDIIKSINSLCVLIYDKDGNLYRKVTRDQMVDYTETKNESIPDDALDGDRAHQAETSTVGASFKLRNVHYGEYYIYAVANMGDLSAYEDKIQTAAGLKSIQVTWNSENIAANNQMFGYFTMDGTPTSSLASAGFQSKEPIKFVNTSAKIHAWLKRTVSKVTIAYDGGGLNDNVFVYIHNVTIHDIPNTCYIGQKNEPKNFNQLLNRPTETTVLPNTRFIYNANGDIISPAQDTKGEPIDVFERWMRVTNVNTPGEMGVKGSDHAANSESLFFFENIQGDYEGQDKYNKRQQREGEDKVGTNIKEPGTNEAGNPNDFKDRIEYGTYIEVEGYYVSLNENNASQGPIKYRFMLGKNTTFNYDAQRNYHYKLTLGFKGWANQPDWHIEYEEDDPGIEVVPIIRMSYLYNTKSTMHVKLNGNCEELTLKIDENNWAPFDINTETVPDNPVPSSPAEYQFRWAKDVYDASKENDGMNGVDRPYLGFLALQVPGNTAKDIPTSILENITNGNKNDGQLKLKSYYEGSGEGNSIPQDSRTFKGSDFTVGKHTAPQRNNDWEVRAIKDNDGNVDSHSTMLLVPLWTRNKSMIRNANFSGNNTFEYYYRKAVVTLTGKFKVGNVTKEVSAKCIVYQEPRIVNPKAVWRKAGSNSDFQVSLMQAAGSNAQDDYEPLVSVGTWRAYVEVSNNKPFIKLVKSDKTYGEIKGDTVCGKAGSPVDFTIEFPQTTTEAAPNYAVVNVEYHDENCTHKIFVRQGYENDTEFAGNYWSTYSLYSAVLRSGTDGSGTDDVYNATLTKSPLAVGSFFRRGKQSAGILPSNVTKGPKYQAMGAPGSTSQTAFFDVANAAHPNIMWTFTSNKVRPEYTIETNKLSFRDDLSNTTRNMGTYYFNGRTYKVPELADFMALTDASEFAFGVVYGDGATKTSDKFAVATGYEDNTNSGNGNANGVRAAIAYEATTGKQVIFPFGKYGMGRRRQRSFYNDAGNWGRQWAGSLWYSDINSYSIFSTNSSTSANWWRPLVWNLSISPGAIYWIDKWVNTGTYSTNVSGKNVTYILDSPSMGWDMNYVYLDFNQFSENNYADACLIKLIRVR